MGITLRPDDSDCLCEACECFINGIFYGEKFGGYVNPLLAPYGQQTDGCFCICKPCACEKCHEDGDKSKTFCYHPKAREMVVHFNKE